MSSYYQKSVTSTSTSSPSLKKVSRLKDNSWIRRDEEEDEDVDRDPNFGKSILGHVSTVTSDSSTQKKSDTKVTSSVQALSKRFSSSQDELNTTSASPSYGTKTTTNKWSSPTSSPVTTIPKRSSTTTTVTDNGKMTETTTTTTRSGTFTDRVFSDGKTSTKGSLYSPLSPSSTKVTETTVTKGAEDLNLNGDAVTSSKTVTVSSGTNGTYKTSTTRTSSSAEDKLSDPYSSVSTTVTRTSVVESPKQEVFPSTATTKSYSTAEDKLYDTLLPKSMTDLSSSTSTSITRREVKTVESSVSDKYSPYSPTYTGSALDFSKEAQSPVSDRYSSTRTYSSSGLDSGDKYNTSSRTYSSSGPDSSYDYSTINSPSVYTTTSTTYKDSRMDDYMDGDSYSTKSSIQTVYSAPERTVLEKELCSYCRKPFNAEAKMVLDDMKINCHASCFKCEVCSNNLGNLKAGDSLWIYRRTVHCDRCFDVTREKWRR